MLTNLHQLESDLWQAADQLRANSKLTATEYNMSVLGLIFLRHATNRFKAVKAEIEPTLPPLRRVLELNAALYLDLIHTDTDFDLIRDDPRFKALVAEFTPTDKN